MTSTANAGRGCLPNASRPPVSHVPLASGPQHIPDLNDSQHKDIALGQLVLAMSAQPLKREMSMLKPRPTQKKESSSSKRNKSYAR